LEPSCSPHCQLRILPYRRRLEKAHIKRAVEIINRKKAEKEAAAQAKREEGQRLKEADKKAKEAKKS
jgi:cytochrome c oxidase assembly protein subunit 20